jgi:hypothetical protein
MGASLGIQFEIGDEVKVPSYVVLHSFATYGKIIGKKMNPLPIYTVEIKLNNGLKIIVDVHEEELRFI